MILLPPIQYFIILWILSYKNDTNNDVYQLFKIKVWMLQYVKLQTLLINCRVIGTHYYNISQKWKHKLSILFPNNIFIKLTYFCKWRECVVSNFDNGHNNECYELYS